jgi:phosphoribosyl 1,2-cyclic phosphodiesterase
LTVGSVPEDASRVRAGGGASPDGLVAVVWGAGGSAPAARAARARWGGETVCFEFRAGPGAPPLVVDLGSGARALGAKLAEEVRNDTRTPPKVEVILTHFHFDHVMGMPFFAPFYIPGAEVRTHCGVVASDAELESRLKGFASPPWFPVEPLSLGAARFRAFDPAEPFEAAGFRVLPIRLNHPGGCIGVRLETDDGAVCIVGDHEHGEPEIDAALEAAVTGADLMIYDGAYDEATYPPHEGWGHSTWEKGVELARAAGVRRTLIHHHLPHLDDDALDARDAEIRAALSSAGLARQDRRFAIRAGAIAES